MNTSPLLPPALDVAFYRSTYADLRHMSDEGLAEHYHTHGKTEGRMPNCLLSRQDFVALMGSTQKILEVGPFTNPTTSGANVRYADFLSRDELIDRAQSIGIDPTGVPYIDYVLSRQPLSAIEEDFDFVVTSHCIEHQPDLIKHLSEVRGLIEKRNGKYFVLVPDKRYCFDRFMPETTIADILDSHARGATVHSLKSVIEHRALMTHNDPGRHWTDPALEKPVVNPDHVRSAFSEWSGSNGAYIDVHAWYFTPATFIDIIALLGAAGLIGLQVEEIYDTRFGSNEFWAVLGLAERG